MRLGSMTVRRIAKASFLAVAFLATLGCSLSTTASAHSWAVRLDVSSGTRALDELTAAKAVVLGVVEGLTEYLPVSSTGHLTVAERLLHVGRSDATSRAVKSYTVIIQIGAIVAVVWLYWGRLVQLLRGLFGGDREGRRILVALLVAFVPAALVGKGLEDPIERHLLGPFPVAMAWLVGGVGILVFVRRRPMAALNGKSLAALTNRQALLIGLAQVLALWPGTSRSLVTIVGGLLVGMNLAAAVEFSFLLGLGTLSAATGYEILRHGTEVTGAFGLAAPAVGIVTAFVTAFAAVKWMVAYLNRRDLSLFGWYRIAIGACTVALLGTGVL